MTTEDMDRIAEPDGTIKPWKYQQEKNRLALLDQAERAVIRLKLEIAEAQLEELREAGAGLRERQAAGGRIGGLARVKKGFAKKGEMPE